MIRLALAFLAIVSFASVMAVPAAAVPITYVESIDGDLSVVDPLTVFTLDVGLNTVSGSFGSTEQDTDFDSFAFIVPAGLQVVSGGVELLDLTGDITSTQWSLFSGSTLVGVGSLVQNLAPSSPGSAPLTVLPLGPGSYNMSHVVFFFAGTEPSNTASYQFTLDVQSEVPEPATWALLGVGLVAVACRARVRRPA